jgi:cysteinyl-tRNA synthetase
MSGKYLGDHFDIHGGGMDLLFPHHESEIAQSRAANGTDSVKYWLHNNMVTINGQKMGKSLGNFITLEEFFTGKHKALEQAYSPMTIRFFILQAHYRSTLDFSNEALQAAEKGLKKLQAGIQTLKKLKSVPSTTEQADQVSGIRDLVSACSEAMNDDFNSPMVIASLFEAVRIINSANDGKENLSGDDIEQLNRLFTVFFYEILGMKDESSEDSHQVIDGLMNLILDIRKEVRAKKDFSASDQIRDALQNLNIRVKDTKDGAAWEID